VEEDGLINSAAVWTKSSKWNKNIYSDVAISKQNDSGSHNSIIASF